LRAFNRIGILYGSVDDTTDSHNLLCKLCGAKASRGHGLQLGVGWTSGWSDPYFLCFSCIEKEHGVQIGTSGILPDEMGLFATRIFKKDEFIVPYCGEEITVAEMVKRYGVNSAPCGAYLSVGYSVDAGDRFLHGLGRYANDSQPFSDDTDNNAYINNFLVGPPNDPDHTSWPGLFASKEILPGDEITVAYGKDYWDVWSKKLSGSSE
jgi:hypothetical protein